MEQTIVFLNFDHTVQTFGMLAKHDKMALLCVMKMLRVGFICLVVLMANVKSKKMRLNVIESRLTTLEMRMNIESVEIKSTVESVEALNNSISEIEEKICLKMDLNTNTDRHEHKQDTKFSNENRAIKAFMEQKEWLHSVLVKTENRTRQYEQHLLQFEEKITNDVTQRIENIETGRYQLEEKLERLQETVDSLETSVKILTQKNDVKLLKTEIREMKTMETQQNELLARFQQTLTVLKTNLTSLAQKNEYLAAELEKKDKVIKDILLEKEALKETQKPVETVKTCPSGWQSFSMYCYLFEDRAMAYPDAKRFCTDEGAHVVDIQSKLENDFVSQLSNRKLTWIGMTDEETEGQWILDITGKLATYTNWISGQPNNIANRQHCAIMGEGTPPELWGDVPCDFSYRVVCKVML